MSSTSQDPIASHLATLGHIERVSSRIATLVEHQHSAEAQFACAVAREYRRGELSFAEVMALFTRLRAAGLAGFTTRWNAEQTAPELRAAVLLRGEALTPNRAEGSWEGVWPPDGPAPVSGLPVVYVLYDHENAPCYVGSTERFRARLKRHSKDGKQFARWMAYPCADREAAYDLEVRLLQEHKPYLNRKMGR